MRLLALDRMCAWTGDGGRSSILAGVKPMRVNEPERSGRIAMQTPILRLAGAAAALLLATSAQAQNTVKIGLIMPYSGQFADTATQMDNAIKLYVKQHGDTVA